MPEDLGTPGGGVVRCFCKPGVKNKSRSKGLELSYITRGSGTLENQGNQISEPFTTYDNWTKFEFDLKAPIINSSSFKLLVGYKYTSEKLNINNIGNDFSEIFNFLKNENLKSSNFSAIVTKPLNEKNYIAFRMRYTANGNYNGIFNFENENAIYKAMGVFGIKKREDFEWGIGINFSKSFRRTNVLPFIIYNRTFVNNWGIEAAFPGYLYMRYNYSPKSIFLMGTEYASDSYRVDGLELNNDPMDYAFNHSEILFLFRWEQKIVPWVWGNLRAGYQLNFSSDMEAKNSRTTAFQFDSTDTPFFEIGIFISPPNSVLK